MKKRDDRAYLFDMVRHAEEAHNFCSGHNLQSFKEDRQLRWATAKLIQVVGEASVKVSKSGQSTYPDVPWDKLRGMRNVLVHQYEDIDDTILWKTMTENIPPLIRVLKDILSSDIDTRLPSKIIAIRQSPSGQNEFFISDSYDEYELPELIELTEMGLIKNAETVRLSNGEKYVRSKKNDSEKDNLDQCAITCNDFDYLLFDGRRLVLRAKNGADKRSWPAVSGMPGSTAADQSKENFGPIPEGVYSVRFDKTLDIVSGKSLWDRIKWLLKSPTWGLIVTPLEPSLSNNMYGRSNFSIHGGFYPNSKGCIDLTSYNSDFHSVLRLYKRKFELKVEYKN